MKRFTLHATRFIALLAGLLMAMPASAALLFSEPRQIEITPDQTFEVGVFLDTQNDDINAIEGEIEFPQDLLELREIRDGNSIINFWVDRPVLGPSPMRFSGIIPGGYRFPKGLVLSLVFQSKKNGSGTIRIENAHTLRNDGQGTETPLTLAISSFIISEQPQFPPPAVMPIVDNTPPETFQPELSSDFAIFSGKLFLSFATQDKGTGIDHYEVREMFAWGMGSWVRAESPYVLIGQNASFPVEVKAVDRTGNSRISRTVQLKRSPSANELIALGVLLAMALMLVLIRKRRKFISLT